MKVIHRKKSAFVQRMIKFYEYVFLEELGRQNWFSVRISSVLKSELIISTQ